MALIREGFKRRLLNGSGTLLMVEFLYRAVQEGGVAILRVPVMDSDVAGDITDENAQSFADARALVMYGMLTAPGSSREITNGSDTQISA